MIQTHFQCEQDYEDYVHHLNTHYPSSAWSSWRTNDKYEYDTHYAVNGELLTPNNPNVKSYRHLCAKRENQMYLPFIGMYQAVIDLVSSCDMLSTALFNKFKMQTMLANPTAPQPQPLSKKITIKIDIFSPTERLEMLAWSIVLLIRALVGLFSLGILNYLFYPIDAMVDQHCLNQAEAIPMANGAE